jgi:transcriptional regulator with XRE-family HTH domain
MASTARVVPAPYSAELRVADRLKRLRQEQGLTLKDLSSTARLSEAYLSRVENHKVAIPIATLERLANALGVSIAALFADDATSVPIAVCRSGQGKRGKLRGPRGFAYRMLADAKRGKLMEPLVVDVASASRVMPLKAHPGEEFNYVLEGEMVLRYGKQRMLLRTGDAVYYDATVPHASCAAAGKPCRVLAVVASRDYLFHGDLSRLIRSTP